MDWERLLVGILITAGVPLAGWLIGTGARCLHEILLKKKAEAQAAGEQLKVIAFDAAQKALEAVTRATVGKIESTTAAELREKVHAGESEFEELQALADDALDEIVAQLEPELLRVLAGSIGDLEGYIRNRIEAVLPEIKAEYAGNRTRQKAAESMRVMANNRTAETDGVDQTA